jgi:ATP-binding cassette, subfamily B, bacterial
MTSFAAMRGFRLDREVTKQRLRPGTMRRIAHYARPYRLDLTIFLIATVADAVTIATYPVLLAVIIDRGILPRRLAVVIWVASAVGGLALLDAGVNVIQRWYSARIGQGLVYDLRTQVFEHVQRQPLAFFTRTQTGSLVSRLNGDVVGAQQAVTMTLSTTVSSVLQVLLILGVMFYFSWLVSAVALFLIPVFLIPARYIGRRLQRLTRESMQLDAEIGSNMTERFNVSGAMLVKLFGRHQEETRAFASKAAKLRDVGVATSLYGWVLFIVLGLLAAMAMAVVYGLGGSLVIGGTIRLGTLVALAALLARLYGPITQLSNMNVNVMSALVSFDRIFELLDLEPLIEERPGAFPLAPAKPRTRQALPFQPDIVFDHVSFRFPAASEISLASLESAAQPAADRTDVGEEVLHDICFTAPAGRLTALVGPSGAGKTTITKLVSRLYDPAQGAVLIGGIDVRDVTFASLREVIGVVTQDAHLFHDTIRANLAYAQPGATEQDMENACRAAQIWNLIKVLPDGLDTMAGDRGYRLSGGEKQRIALARLLLKAPAVIVLDEATAHLDTESEAAIQNALRHILSGRTSLVVAHRLATIREADQILVIEEGRICERGPHLELLAAGGLYSSLYRTQFAQPKSAGFSRSSPRATVVPTR